MIRIGFISLIVYISSHTEYPLTLNSEARRNDILRAIFIPLRELIVPLF